MKYVITESEKDLIRRMHNNQKSYDVLLKESTGLVSVLDSVVITDWLSPDDRYLILLDELYGQIDSDKEYLFKVTENVYRVKSYKVDFKNIFDKLTSIDMIEGLVMKRKNARLELGTSENNNTKSELKCRKATKNYKF